MRRIRRLRLRFTLGLLVAILAWPTTEVLFNPRPAFAFSSGYGIVVARGFDMCQDPDTGQTNAWWPGTPWWFIGLYVGGSSMGCSQPNLSAQYLNDVNAQGWHLGFFWVGPQAPCSGFASQFSSDPGTAYQQGRNEAAAAYNMLWQNLGIANFADHTPVTYDLEAFNGSQCNALAAAQSFVHGWIYQLHLPTPQLAGVYGSTCGSYLDSYRPDPFPDFIWGASWDGNPSTGAMPCVSSGNWIANQRIKQFVGGHNETWNGVTLNIDTDCANGPMAPPPNLTADTSCQ